MHMDLSEFPPPFLVTKWTRSRTKLRVSSIKKDEFVNEKYKLSIFIGINGRISNWSRGLGICIETWLSWSFSCSPIAVRKLSLAPVYRSWEGILWSLCSPINPIRCLIHSRKLFFSIVVVVLIQETLPAFTHFFMVNNAGLVKSCFTPDFFGGWNSVACSATTDGILGLIIPYLTIFSLIVAN